MLLDNNNNTDNIINNMNNNVINGNNSENNSCCDNKKRKLLLINDNTEKNEDDEYPKNNNASNFMEDHKGLINGNDHNNKRVWSALEETILFQIMEKYPPIGMQKYFNMLSIKLHLQQNGIHITSKQIWDHLLTLYNLESECLIGPDEEDQPPLIHDFNLPKSFINLHKDSGSQTDSDASDSSDHTESTEDIENKKNNKLKKKTKYSDQPHKKHKKMHKEDDSDDENITDKKKKNGLIIMTEKKNKDYIQR